MVRLALCGLTLPGMIDEPGSLAGRRNSPAQRAGHAQPAHVVGDFHQRAGQCAGCHAPAPRHPGCPALQTCWAHPQRFTCLLRQLGRYGRAKPAGAFSPVPTAVPPMARRVIPAAQPRYPTAAMAIAPPPEISAPASAACGIPQMGASDLDDTCKFAVFSSSASASPCSAGNSAGAIRPRWLHATRWESHRCSTGWRWRGRWDAPPAPPSPACPSNWLARGHKHLIHVHVGLRARTGLPNRQRKFIGMMPLQHLIGSLLQGFGHGQNPADPSGHWRTRACMFDLCQRMQ